MDVGDTWARSPARTSLMSAISELQRRKELGFGTSSQVNWFCRSRDVSRKGSGELWVALPSCKADEGGVLDSFIMCVFVYVDGHTTVHVWRTEDTLQGHLFSACGSQGSNSGCQAGLQEPSPSCQPAGLTATSDSQRREYRKMSRDSVGNSQLCNAGIQGAFGAVG